MCLLLVCGYSHATHIVGGELQLIHQDASQYSLQMILYFDDIHGNPGAIDGDARISIFSKSSNAVINVVFLPLTSDVIIPYTNPLCASTPDLRTRKLLYQRNIILDERTYNEPDGYYAVYERCCRNHDIENIQNPENAGATFYLEIPPVVKNGIFFQNSTPTAKGHLGDFACINQPFSFDFSSTDKDGDELVYSLETPLRGYTSDRCVSVNSSPCFLSDNPAPYPKVIFSPGYSLDNTIPGDPSLSIDSNTGYLSLTPNREGLFAFAVKCEEFRSGVKIGEVRKEFQLLVISCPPVASEPSIAVVYKGKKYNEKDTITFYIDEKDQCLNIKGYDERADTRFFLESFIPGLSDYDEFEISGDRNKLISRGDTAHFKACLKKCRQKIFNQVYELYLRLGNNTCPVPLYDTAIVLVQVLDTNRKPQITFPSLEYDAENNVFTARATVNQEIIFEAIASSGYNNQVELSAQGELFNSSDLSIFSTVSGLKKVESTFSWTPQCENLTESFSSKVHRIQFFAKESHPCKIATDTAYVNIRVESEDRVFDSFPNAFSPNGDSFNQTFQLTQLPVDLCGDKFLGVKIFNRWGEEIFNSSDPAFEWKAESIASGIYFYALIYQKSTFKGTIHLLK